MSDYRDSRSSRDNGSSAGYKGGDKSGDKSGDPRPPLPTRGMMGSRIYVGKLPADIREREVEKVFGKYGRINEIAMKGNYCFIQYDSSRDAKDAVYEMNDRSVFGDRLQVEHARTPKEFGFNAPSRGGGYGGSYGYSSRGYSSGYGGSGRYGRNDYNNSRSYSGSRKSPPVRSDYRLSVTNLSTRCNAQDLKEVMAKAGEVVYSDAHRRRVGEGIVEFASRKDMERALKKLDGLEINGKPIKLEIQEVRKSRRSRSRSASRSKSRSRSRSGSSSPSRKKRRRSSSRSASEEGSGNEAGSKKGDKSDDEEFEEAERSVKQKKERRKQAGDDSESERDYDVVDDDDDKNDDDGDKKNDDKGDDDDEEIEEVEVEEEIVEEIEVDDDEQEEDEVKVEEKKEPEPMEEEASKTPEKRTRLRKAPVLSTRRSSRRSAGKAPSPEHGGENEDE